MKYIIAAALLLAVLLLAAACGGTTEARPHMFGRNGELTPHYDTEPAS